ncbi:hypothetical protein ACFCZ1_29245 [Streptomyces sp. NPDC056224]|uniref:hypothetical protein n=1 Tax=Streptomyces sp. NPDC056224 TaxID=3345750 RepID=UPI0035D692D7
MTAAQVKGALGPTSFAETARLTGEFTDWHNLLYKATWLAGELNLGDTDDVAQENAYQHFAAQQRSRFAGAWGEERRAFWHSYAEEFGTYPPRFQVGAEHRGEPKLKVVTRDLPADAKARVHAFSLQARATPFAVTSASVLAGMREVTGDPLGGISTNQHGRMLPGTSQTVGLFVQTVPLHLGREIRSPLETVREVFLRTHDVFECSLPLRVAGRYWNEDLMVPDQEPGLYVVLNEDLPSSADLPPLAGTEAEYAELDIKGGKRWPETVVVEWNLYETAPRLSALRGSQRSRDEAARPRCLMRRMRPEPGRRRPAARRDPVASRGPRTRTVQLGEQIEVFLPHQVEPERKRDQGFALGVHAAFVHILRPLADRKLSIRQVVDVVVDAAAVRIPELLDPPEPFDHLLHGGHRGHRGAAQPRLAQRDENGEVLARRVHPGHRRLGDRGGLCGPEQGRRGSEDGEFDHVLAGRDQNPRHFERDHHGEVARARLDQFRAALQVLDHVGGAGGEVREEQSAV